ncbi:ankyrin repeat domain-containing protein [Vacuolonema iberomarrocanum]|uniref:ankyrin repeat domain-containing protein n=1 Tax=Vacuolonema iberomarrocanum TaxID=3454632 RepID=UPI003F6DCB8A
MRATEGYAAIVEQLLAHGAEVNTKNPTTGYMALMFAAESDRREIVEVLLDHGAGLGDRNAYQETVVMVLVRHGQTDLVQRLVQMGTDIRAVNKIGDTAFYSAMRVS